MAESEILFLLEKILLSVQISTLQAIEETIESFTLRPIHDINVTFTPLKSDII
jgi:hypothetical protein